MRAFRVPAGTDGVEGNRERQGGEKRDHQGGEPVEDEDPELERALDDVFAGLGNGTAPGTTSRWTETTRS